MINIITNKKIWNQGTKVNKIDKRQLIKSKR